MSDEKLSARERYERHVQGTVSLAILRDSGAHGSSVVDADGPAPRAPIGIGRAGRVE